MARKDTPAISNHSPAARRATSETKKRHWMIVVSGVAVIGLCFVAKSYVGTSTAQAQIFGALRRHGEGQLILSAQRSVSETPHQGRGVQVFHDRDAQWLQEFSPQESSSV